MLTMKEVLNAMFKHIYELEKAFDAIDLTDDDVLKNDNVKEHMFMLSDLYELLADNELEMAYADWRMRQPV